MDYNGLRLITIDYDGLRWIIMHYDGLWLITMDYDGLRWNTMDYNGLRWTIMDYDGLRWIIDSEGLPTTIYYNGLIWSTLILADHGLLSIPKPPKPPRPVGAGMAHTIASRALGLSWFMHCHSLAYDHRLRWITMHYRRWITTDYNGLWWITMA
jgi:hypothetical protein